LLVAAPRGSRIHRDVLVKPQVAFMCSPGNASRWIQGRATALPVPPEERYEEFFRRLLAHAPEAATFIDGPLPVVPLVLAVTEMRVVDPGGTAPVLYRFVTSDPRFRQI
jgi:hypothetical protein